MRPFFFLASIVLISVLGSGVATAQQPAFPGAEGGGMYTRGGRGGKVLEVTTLFDTTATNVVGTLRWAVNQTGARTVVFRVSGTIDLVADLRITRDSITIAGQTAPGDGICLKRYPLVVSANEVIVRFLRVRLGNESGGESDAMSGFTNATTGQKRKIIIDHCSVSWSVDEALSFYGNFDVTVQWCLISESLYNSNHPKGFHGYGGIWGGADRTTFHHNLVAHHSSRVPRISGVGTTVGAYNVDVRNNVFYNWGSNSSYGGEQSTGNFVNNYYRYGPGTKSGVRSRIWNPYDTLGRWYVEGNVVYGNAAVTADNWAGGVVPQVNPANLQTLRALAPFSFEPVTTESAEEAYARVVAHAGATLPKRDTLDARIAYEAANGTALFGGPTWPTTQGFNPAIPTGIIDVPSDVGGWPVLNSLPAPADTDHDGMPDDWETARGLDPSFADDRNFIGPSGYTRLEEYLNMLADDGTTGVVAEGLTPSGFLLEQNYPNPFNPATSMRFTVPVSGHVTLRVFTLLGQPVATLFDGEALAGTIYHVTFDGAGLATGTYLARLAGAGHSQSRRMLLAK
jgi:hypothetical protein